MPSRFVLIDETPEWKPAKYGTKTSDSVLLTENRELRKGYPSYTHIDSLRFFFRSTSLTKEPVVAGRRIPSLVPLVTPGGHGNLLLDGAGPVSLGS